MASQSRWLDLIEWLQSRSAHFSTAWPPELPPEATPGFWSIAQRQEAAHRREISEKLRRWLEQPDQVRWTPLESWLLLRRVEFAMEVALLKAGERIEPVEPLAELLPLLLIDLWEAHGADLLFVHSQVQPPLD